MSDYTKLKTQAEIYAKVGDIFLESARRLSQFHHHSKSRVLASFAVDYYQKAESEGIDQKEMSAKKANAEKIHNPKGGERVIQALREIFRI